MIEAVNHANFVNIPSITIPDHELAIAKGKTNNRAKPIELANIITPIPNDLNKLCLNRIQPFVKACKGFVPSIVIEHITIPMLTNTTIDTSNGTSISRIDPNRKARYSIPISKKTVAISNAGTILSDLM